MATTKIWNIVDNLGTVIGYSKNKNKTQKKNELDLKQAINYAMNKNKTEEQYFVDGINCEVESAFQEMQDIKRLYDKQGGNLGYHAIQSFKEGEVTPEIAHEIGMRLAQEIWGDRFQVIVTTHLNTNHIHNHFIVNSVSFKDGKKYYDTHYTYAIIRNKSDEICKEYNLSVLKEKTTEKTKINYSYFYQQYEKQDDYTTLAKRDLDFAIKQAFSYKDFLKIMEKMHYLIYERSGKLSIRHKDTKRNIRIERRFGENYTIENIKRRILNETAIRVPFVEEYFSNKKNTAFKLSKKKIKITGFMAIYFHYMYLLKLYPKNPYKKLSPEMIADIRKMDKLSEEAKILATNKINNEEDLNIYINRKEDELSNILGDRDNLWKKRSRTKEELERRKICNQISEKNEIIKRLRKEMELVEDIKSRIPKIKVNIKQLMNEEKEKSIKQKEIKRKEK